MWEISGKGLKHPSYLFGTMHVSSKIAFNLSDSFYNALKSVDAAAIEIDPLTWQDEYNTSIYNKIGPGIGSMLSDYATNNFISKNSYLFTESDMNFRIALATDPAIINHFLYRNYQGVSDFEENTYIDMHIFQSARKLKKSFYPLENFKESEALMMKGYKAQAAAKRKKKSRSTEVDSDEVKSSKASSDNVEDAYRNGDLDLMDSLDRVSDYNEVFNEYFLYERNKVQANGIDKIITKGQSVFAAVGAAHLPGDRGVIELLRAKGYKLRPIFMGIKVSNQRDVINKMKLPVTFTTQKADDNLFTVDVPGKLYNFKGGGIGLSDNQFVHADFSNGAYYMVTRVPTNNLLWGKTIQDVYNKIDSLLYENIPGKILERTPITNNGFSGYNIVNKTKKGDVQRYNIIVTPLELLVFKMSGFEDYVSGVEGNTFFNSIKINKPKDEWSYFSPKESGYKILLPNHPIVGESNSGRYGRMRGGESNNDNYEAYDDKQDIYMMVSKKNFTNYNFLEEDTFNLALANESMLSSALFDNPASRVMGKQNNIPYIETKGVFNNNYNYTNRIYLVGNDYYAVITRHKNKDSIVNAALNSFNFSSYKYGAAHDYSDSNMHFKVNSVLAPDSLTNEFIEITKLAKKTQEEESKTSKYEEPYNIPEAKMVFSNDTTGEEVIVKSEKFPKYYHYKDSVEFWKNIIDDINVNINNLSISASPFGTATAYQMYYDFYVKEKTFSYNNNQTVCNVVYTDTNSSQIIRAKFILTGNRLLTAYCLDNAEAASTAKKDFLESFAAFLPDTTVALSQSKADIYFQDFYSKDSTTSKFAKRNIDMVHFTQNDILQILGAINSLNIKDKDYFTLKTNLIDAIGYIKTNDAVVDALESIYKNAGDTSTFQNTAIINLSKCKTQKAYKLLGNIIDNDPPIFENSNDASTLFNHLSDSMQLTKAILPQVLSLVNLDDYKMRVYGLISQMLDSVITQKEYKSIYDKVFFDAKIALKKLKAADEKITNTDEDESNNNNYSRRMPNIEKLIRNGGDVDRVISRYSSYDNNNSTSIMINEDIVIYCQLLIPYYNKNNNARLLIDKLLAFKSNELKLNIAKVLNWYKIPVADSIWQAIAKDDKTRLDLLKFTLRTNQSNLFPQEYTKQSVIAKNILQKGYNKKDSLEYLNVYLPIHLKNKDGNVHFFKYKNDEKDVDWKIAYCGTQPSDTTKVNTSQTFEEFSYKVLKTNKTIEEQAAKIIKEEVYKNRKSSSNFYENSRSYDYYRD
ncbi:MAG: TraB/GumN family protein [Bacteroidetes bacterium]|nr:TraB/GumN family protein [Bacteroidota bacterium]